MNLPIFYLTVTYTDQFGRRLTQDVSIPAESYADAIRLAADLIRTQPFSQALSVAEQREAIRIRELRAALAEAQEALLHNSIDTGPLPGLSQRIRQILKETE